MGIGAMWMRNQYDLLRMKSGREAFLFVIWQGLITGLIAIGVMTPIIIIGTKDLLLLLYSMPILLLLGIIGTALTIWVYPKN